MLLILLYFHDTLKCYWNSNFESRIRPLTRYLRYRITIKHYRGMILFLKLSNKNFLLRFFIRIGIKTDFPQFKYTEEILRSSNTKKQKVS